MGTNPRNKSRPTPDVAESSTASSTTSTTANTTTNVHHVPSTTPSTPNAGLTLHNASSSQSLPGSIAPSGGASTSTTSTASGTQTPSTTKNWLRGTGSWRRKAPATVTTAKESIGVGVSGGAPAELPGHETKKPRDESPARFLTKRKSSKSFALPASTTKVHVSSDGLVDDSPKVKPVGTTDETTAAAAAATTTADPPPTPPVDEPPLPPDPPKAQTAQTADGWAWRSWWSRPDGYSGATKANDEAQRTRLPDPTPSEEPDATAKGLGSSSATIMGEEQQDKDTKDVPPEQDAVIKDAPPEQGTVIKDAPPAQDTAINDAPPASDKPSARPSSWFWSWSSAQNAPADPPPAPPPADQAQPPPVEQAPASPIQGAPAPSEPASQPAQDAQPSQPAQQTDTPPVDATPTVQGAQSSTKPSGWAFWYRGKSENSNKPADGVPQKHVGEVAVFDTPSQSHPEAAQFNEQQQPKDDAPQEPPEPPKRDSITTRSIRSLRGRPKTKDRSKDASADTSASSTTITPTSTSPTRDVLPSDTAPTAQSAPSASKQTAKAKQEPPNLVFPEFKTTYQMVQQPSFWKQVRQYFLGNEPATPHLHINPAPPRIKKAVAIGVHGYFPAPIFQKVIGQPKGTSIRFANSAATAIKDWTEARGYTPEIEQIALEGEGFIAERVNTLWKLLLNWINHIKAADFILVACHSQGVPVAIMLVAKLIQFGCVGPTRIGICAMAGVNMGPFIEYKTKYLGATAAELFEFSNPKSLVSQMYLAALHQVLRFGVRITYVGSIDDQLVSLESSTFSSLSHPYIYRAVFVDGRIHAPDFLTHLVGFTLKLRNLGLPDHGLIRELSPALAGSLYGGEGHSRVYEDPKVYELAVQHALETTNLPVQTREREAEDGEVRGIRIPIIGGGGGGNKTSSQTQTKDKKKQDVYMLRVKDYESPAAGGVNQNPFFLPWAMRGLLEEEFVKKALGKEVEELLGLFEEWNPSTKMLKDVKFRLEGVRSKL